MQAIGFVAKKQTEFNHIRLPGFLQTDIFFQTLIYILGMYKLLPYTITFVQIFVWR